MEQELNSQKLFDLFQPKGNKIPLTKSSHRQYLQSMMATDIFLRPYIQPSNSKRQTTLHAEMNLSDDLSQTIITLDSYEYSDDFIDRDSICNEESIDNFFELRESKFASEAAQEAKMKAINHEVEERRNRKSRRITKKPTFKQYFEKCNMDVVIFGRGSYTNAHNKSFRKKAFQFYPKGNKHKHGHVVQQLIHWVKDHHGRFLDKDSNGWYEGKEKVFKTKVRSLLREGKTKVKFVFTKKRIKQRIRQ